MTPEESRELAHEIAQSRDHATHTGKCPLDCPPKTDDDCICRYIPYFVGFVIAAIALFIICRAMYQSWRAWRIEVLKRREAKEMADFSSRSRVGYRSVVPKS